MDEKAEKTGTEEGLRLTRGTEKKQGVSECVQRIEGRERSVVRRAERAKGAKERKCVHRCPAQLVY